MTVEQYHDVLKKFAPKQGLILNPDWEVVKPLLLPLEEEIRLCAARSCPCRPATGDMEKDKDIVCPCEYAKPDVEEFGACYCWLYVSQDWIDGKVEHIQIPERRPVEKILDF